MIRNTADNAAYEGARLAMLPGVTADRAKQASQRSLNAIGVKGANIAIDPPTITNTIPNVTVTITIPILDNSYGVTRFFTSGQIVKTCTLSREIVLAE